MIEKQGDFPRPKSNWRTPQLACDLLPIEGSPTVIALAVEMPSLEMDTIRAIGMPDDVRCIEGHEKIGTTKELDPSIGRNCTRKTRVAVERERER
jgi:hypothetical protein